MADRVLVTGANGKTGRAVVAALTKRGAVVRAFIRKAEQADALKAIGAAEIALGDMAAPETIAPAVKGCTALVHIGPPMHPDEKAMTAQVLLRQGSVLRRIGRSPHDGDAARREQGSRDRCKFGHVRSILRSDRQSCASIR